MLARWKLSARGAPWSSQALPGVPLPRLLYLPRLWVPRFRASRTGFLSYEAGLQEQEVTLEIKSS